MPVQCVGLAICHTFCIKSIAAVPQHVTKLNGSRSTLPVIGVQSLNASPMSSWARACDFKQLGVVVNAYSNGIWDAQLAALAITTTLQPGCFVRAGFCLLLFVHDQHSLKTLGSAMI